MVKEVRDDSWLRRSFMITKEALDAGGDDTLRRFYTTAAYKFVDTTLGGDFVLNPLPQFTRNADRKVKSKLGHGKGLGRRYSEVLHDNRRRIHIRAGVLRHNSLSVFFSQCYHVEAATLARTGRLHEVMFTLGSVVGFILAAPLLPIVLTSKMIQFAMRLPSSRFCYIKPTMHNYHQALATTFQNITVNMGIQPRIFTDEQAGAYYEDDSEAIAANKAQGEYFNKILPDIYDENGQIDIFKVVTRAQRLANAYIDALEEGARIGLTRKEIFDAVLRAEIDKTWLMGNENGLERYKQLFMSSMDGEYKNTGGPEKADVEYITKMDSLKSYYDAERRMGADYISFRVSNVGPQNGSFNNTFKESTIGSTFNAMSSSARSARFNLADGNIDGMGVAKAIYDAAGAFASGVLAQFDIQGISALAGNAYIDIPWIWDRSQCELNKVSFTIQCRSWSAHPYLRAKNLILPMAAWLALGVPLSAGKQSFTQPFVIEYFDPGRATVRVGAVESLSFSWGEGNVGWNSENQYLSADIQVGIVDLCKAFHMPIYNNFSFTNAAAMFAAKKVGQGIGGTLEMFGVNTSAEAGGEVGTAIGAAIQPSAWDDANVYTDLMATWGSLSFEDQTGTMRKLKLAMTRQIAQYNQWTSKARMMSYGFSGAPVPLIPDIIKMFSLETARR